ncbi:hypothetical protein J2T13_003980 [Paenibacillus sp. DS2015]
MKTNPAKNFIERYHLTNLSTLQITERQATGYLLLAASGTYFLME